MATSLSRRAFLKSAGAATTTAVCASPALAAGSALASKSTVYRVHNCPVHDNQLRHVGVDALLDLLAANGTHLYRTAKSHAWGAATGIINKDDVVLIKINAQWKCRGATNTDVLRGLIHRILEHPDGFAGEVVMFENGQGQASFDGKPKAWSSYNSYPEIVNAVSVNAEDVTLTIDKLVSTVFAGKPVSSFLLDPVRERFITAADHSTNGFRKISSEYVSYPCFKTGGGKRVELKEGIWNGTGYSSNLKLINVPVFKHHEGSGTTGALKHCYGIFSTADGLLTFNQRHYQQCGNQCGKMWKLIRPADLHIVDCIWINHQVLHNGYPPENTVRKNILLAGLDPVALDYYASKHILLPLGGENVAEHDPDKFSGLISKLTDARNYINANGGINGSPAHTGDENITVVSRDASATSTQPPRIRGGGNAGTLTVSGNDGALRFTLDRPGKIRIDIHDGSGRLLASPVAGPYREGTHTVRLGRSGIGHGEVWGVLYLDGRRMHSVRL